MIQLAQKETGTGKNEGESEEGREQEREEHTGHRYEIKCPNFFISVSGWNINKNISVISLQKQEL